MIIVISNKKINPGRNDDRMFLEEPSGTIGEKIAIATAEHTPRQGKAAQRWSGEKLKEIARSILFSENLWRLAPVAEGEAADFFENLIVRMKEEEIGSKWLFMVHGAGQPTLGALEQAAKVEAIHGVNVILFMWPSWSSPLSMAILGRIAPLLIRRAGVTWPKAALALGYGAYEEKLRQYHQAREMAKTCRTALEAALNMVSKLFVKKASLMEGFSISMMAHSLGALVVESMAWDPAMAGPGKIFSNVILNAADVDSEGHDEWVEAMNLGHRIYVIQNRYDAALHASSALAGNQRRLGTRLKGKVSDHVTAYVDLSPGKGTAARHALFLMSSEANSSIHRMYNRLMRGEAFFGAAVDSLPAPKGFMLAEDNHFTLSDSAAASGMGKD
ncbi:MAG: alpha/beta hydrolase [Nitrospinota bacterium]|nr:alpha/beta hydrolase [Nitrospinota bacterium]